MSRGFAAGAGLALVATISIILALNTKDHLDNTSSVPKTKAVVVAPSKEDAVREEEMDRLNRSMAALSPLDAALYRSIFAAQEKGDWNKADSLLPRLSDKRLIGSVMADRFERRGATVSQLTAWLNVFSAQPEAEAFYAMALKLGAKNPTKPKTNENWSGSEEEAGGAQFSPELMVESTADGSSTKSLARAIRLAVRKGDPAKARDLLVAAQKDKQLAGTFAADAAAVIAESFFRSGERQQAKALATSAAAANQPLALWIRGLIAWEEDDAATARGAFGRLAGHPALSGGNKAAAHFWAYRAESQGGNRKKAREHLYNAAAWPRTFYGLLATQLLGHETAAALSNEAPRWNAKYREVLSASPSGWRALALAQIGQTARAEAELRRLTPLGSALRRRAMMALAHEVPMPALTVKLASLSGEQPFDRAAYPLLPWKPTGGYVVDRALLFAMARHESRFDPEAKSARGARGLMQIMPATAIAMLSGEESSSSVEEAQLFDPSFSMALGQKYVQHLASHPLIGNNLMLLLAAYNGGPTKAASWARGKESTDPLLFLESIPVRETRQYIAQVLPHYWAYRARLDRPTTALRDLAEGKWPNVGLLEKAPVRVAAIGERS